MKIVQKTYNTLRVLSAEMIADAQIGDVRSCLACAPAMFVLFKDFYNYFGGQDHVNRDRFVLADVGLTPLYYATLHTFGIGLTVEDLQNFGTSPNAPATPNKNTIGVDATISSKGQGIPTAVGLAIASQSLASKFNAQKFNVISNYTYCFVSLSNLQEGISQEAMALAGSLKLSKLIMLCNYVEKQVDGGENIEKKYKAMGWNVFSVKDTSTIHINLALARAKQLSLKPTLILLENTLHKTFPNFTNRFITKNEVEKLKADLEFNGAYKIENDVRQFTARTTRKLKVDYSKWEKKVVIYRNTHPQLSEDLNEYFVKPKLTFNKSLKTKIENEDNMNVANGMIIDYIRENYKCLMVASIKEKFLPYSKENCSKRIFSRNDFRAQNLVFGNRENAMAEICGGITLYFGAMTAVFAPICFFGQMLSGVEHASKSNLPVVFSFYQSGKCVDQQKTNIELYGQFEWLRNLKNLDIFQPANPVELLACYANAYEREKPTCVVIPQWFYGKVNTSYDQAKKGAYVLNADEDKNDFTFIASGRELFVATALKEDFNKNGKKVKIVSAPSLVVFNEQSQKYKDSVFGNDETYILLTRANNTQTISKENFNCKSININEFTDSPELITPELIKVLKKEIEK